MRDPARIDVVLDRIREAWVITPDSRLTQLMYNVTYPVKYDLYQIEEEHLLKLLDGYIVKYTKAREGMRE